jgi:molybdopterin-guanine dinucleotide biosynthesis protein A
MLAELAGIVDEVLVVGASADREAGRHPWPMRFVADRVAGCGPLGGIHAALIEARADTVAVIACDMPYVSAPLISHLSALASGVDAVVPRTDRGYHPLCAVYTRACVEPIARRLVDATRLAVAGLFDDVRVRAVGVEELRAFGDVDRLLANVNSPADHRELEALQDHPR